MHLRLALRRWVAALLLVLFAAATVLGHTLVRCQETDGTLSIEWRSAGCCTTNPGDGAKPAPGPAASPMEQEDCGGCTDQALADLHAATKARGPALECVKSPDAPAAPAAFLLHVSPVGPGSAERRARAMRAPRPPPRLTEIRSVVRLC